MHLLGADNPKVWNAIAYYDVLELQPAKRLTLAHPGTEMNVVEYFPESPYTHNIGGHLAVITDLQDSSVKIHGVKYTSKRNGRSIFLPAAGYLDGDNENDVDAIGYYWMNELDTSNNIYAKCFKINGTTAAASTNSVKRIMGCCIRPVVKH